MAVGIKRTLYFVLELQSLAWLHSTVQFWRTHLISWPKRISSDSSVVSRAVHASHFVCGVYTVTS